ncbi:MAG: hypothetical protein RIC54_10225 [Thalassobaculum sp.]
MHHGENPQQSALRVRQGHTGIGAAPSQPEPLGILPKHLNVVHEGGRRLLEDSVACGARASEDNILRKHSVDDQGGGSQTVVVVDLRDEDMLDTEGPCQRLGERNMEPGADRMGKARPQIAQNRLDDPGLRNFGQGHLQQGPAGIHDAGQPDVVHNVFAGATLDRPLRSGGTVSDGSVNVRTPIGARRMGRRCTWTEQFIQGEPDKLALTVTDRTVRCGVGFDDLEGFRINQQHGGWGVGEDRADAFLRIPLRPSDLLLIESDQAVERQAGCDDEPGSFKGLPECHVACARCQQGDQTVRAADPRKGHRDVEYSDQPGSKSPHVFGHQDLRMSAHTPRERRRFRISVSALGHEVQFAVRAIVGHQRDSGMRQM